MEKIGILPAGQNSLILGGSPVTRETDGEPGAQDGEFCEATRPLPPGNPHDILSRNSRWTVEPQALAHGLASRF